MRVLHLEDNSSDALLVRRLLQGRWPECRITLCGNEAQYGAALGGPPFDVILSDYHLGSLSGEDALRLARARAPDTPFLYLSGTIGEDLALAAVHAGAADYVLKDNLKRLVPAVERALAEHGERMRRREAERQILELNHMIDQAGDAIVIVDLTGRIRYWSAGAERLLGWPRSEVVGKTAGDIFRPDVLAGLQDANDRTTAAGAWEGELPLNHRSGETITVAMRRTLVRDEAGRPTAHLSISTDISQKKRLEEHLQRVNRLENVGRIASAVAHDLNNILAPIMLGVPLLRDSVADPEGVNMLGMLEQSASRATELVRNMLAFVSQGSPGAESTSVPQLVAEVSQVVRQSFPPSIRFEAHCPAALPPVAINPTQLHQILMNLCVNARDAMPAGGKLTVRAHRHLVEAAAGAKLKPGEYVELEIEDTGTGISDHVLAHMWQAFYSTKEKGRGTGLGLATVKGIVESHGGAIEVKTVVGEGTLFRLHLPAAATAAADPARAAAAAPPLGHGEMLLFVDDEAAIRLVVSTLLTEAGYQVLLAANGSQALDIYCQRGSDIALVITDNVMPGIDGPRLARLLQGMDPNLRIVAVTGAHGGAAAVFDPGTYHGSVGKPYQGRELLETVARVLREPAGRAGAA